MLERVRCSCSATSLSSSFVEGDIRRLMASVLRSVAVVMSVRCLYNALNVPKNVQYENSCAQPWRLQEDAS